jgi:phosphoribosylformylglycinamidine cyclo-ligase
MPKLFHWLRDQGNVEAQEMFRTFNCGVGMVVIVAARNADTAIKHLQSVGETVSRIGVIRARHGSEHQTQVR